ncbi:hypothetical protein [Spirillospora sp. CA-128828]|uniref:hypothetical protein n=1 Tax=Spirillospora sp. CA-128828 TaxID=3240033 RepID=UPI003D8EEE6F
MPPLLPGGGDLGATAPNSAGRTYRHGTLTGYSMGRCRCAHCRRAYAHYRAMRRAQGKDQPCQGRVLAGGADVQIVRERLGHASLRATERYLHTLPDAGDTALAALAYTRNGIRLTGG